MTPKRQSNGMRSINWVGRTIRGARRPFCPFPAGASPPSTASSGGHDAVPCLAGHSSRSRCRSHSLAMFEAARHHRTSITPGGVATGGLYSTYEIAAAIAVRTKTNSAVWRRLRLSHGILDHGNTSRSACARGNNARSGSCRVCAPHRRSVRAG